MTIPAAPARTKPTLLLTEADKDRLHELLLKRCEYDPETDCWVYTGSWRPKDGVGVMKIRGHALPVRRVAAWIYLGGFDLWDRSIIVRKNNACDCPACFNPEHLRIMRRDPVQLLLFPLPTREAA